MRRMTHPWIRPERALVLLAGVYAAWQAVTGLALLSAAGRQVDEGLMVWGLLGAMFGIPLIVVLAAVGRRLEGTLHGRRPPAPWLWLAVAFGIVFGAHWIAVAVWPVGLLGMAVVEGSARAMERAGIGFGVWVLAAVGLAVAAVASRARERRVWTDASHPVRPAWFPASGLIGVAYVCSCGSAALLGVGWLSSEGWAAGGGAAAVLAWLLAGAAFTVGAAGLTELWRRGGAFGGSLGPHARLEVAGGVLAAHWAPVFLVALTPMVNGDPDLRWSLLGASFVAVLLGTWLWSLGRVSDRAASAI